MRSLARGTETVLGDAAADDELFLTSQLLTRWAAAACVQNGVQPGGQLLPGACVRRCHGAGKIWAAVPLIHLMLCVNLEKAHRQASDTCRCLCGSADMRFACSLLEACSGSERLAVCWRVQVAPCCMQCSAHAAPKEPA